MSALLSSASSEWPEVTLSEVADLVRGVSYPKSDACDEPAVGYVPVLRATNIQDARLVLESDLVHIAERNVSPEQLLRQGDIVVATSSGSKHLVGKSAQLHGKWHGAFGAFCAAIRPRSHIDSRYLALYLQSPGYWRQITKKALGVNINNLRRGDLETLWLPLPPMEVQRGIVAEIEKQFSRLDEAVANLKRVKANLKRYKAVVLKAAVEGHLVDTEAELARREGRGYETGAQLLRRVLDMRRDSWPSKSKYNKPVWADVAATLPEGWTWASLDALLREPLRNGHSARATDNPDGLRAFTLSAVTEGDFSEANTKRTVAAADKVADLWAEPGDIYIERSNTPELVGTARLYRGSPGFAFIPDLLIRVRMSTGVLPGYAEFVLQADEARRYFKSRAQGISGSMPKIDQAVVESVPVPLPPLAEQQRIIAEVERRFSFVHEVALLVDANLKRSSRFRQALLSNAFSGVHPVCDRARGAKHNDRGEIC